MSVGWYRPVRPFESTPQTIKPEIVAMIPF